jgi:hypothetical protein
MNIFFPPILNSRSPIKIRTGNKTVKEYFSSEGTYRGELVGRYLVYRGKGRDILYRYDTDSNELRDFFMFLQKIHSILMAKSFAGDSRELIYL